MLELVEGYKLVCDSCDKNIEAVRYDKLTEIAFSSGWTFLGNDKHVCKMCLKQEFHKKDD